MAIVLTLLSFNLKSQAKRMSQGDLQKENEELLAKISALESQLAKVAPTRQKIAQITAEVR